MRGREPSAVAGYACPELALRAASLAGADLRDWLGNRRAGASTRSSDRDGSPPQGRARSPASPKAGSWPLLRLQWLTRDNRPMVERLEVQRAVAARPGEIFAVLFDTSRATGRDSDLENHNEGRQPRWPRWTSAAATVVRWCPY